MSDVLAVLQLIQTLGSQISRASELLQRMRAEGRVTLTADELAGLQAADDSARNALTEAVAHAKAEGR
jgi:hypothetical protein